MARMRAILLLLVWGGLTAMGLSRLSFNVDVLDLLPRGRPEFDGIRDLYRHFGRKNELLVTLSAPEAEAAKSAAASLGKHLSEGAGLTRRVVWELPFESQPELGGELLAWLWLNSPTASVTALRDRLAPETLPETLTAVLDDLSSGFLGEDTLLRNYDPLGFTELPGGLKRSLGADADLFSSSDGTYRVKNRLLNYCWKLWHSCVITWDGLVVPCCFDKDATHRLGDLKQQRFSELWFGAPYKTFRQQLLQGRSQIDICTNCTEGCRVWVRRYL